MIINHNIAAMNTHRQLGANTANTNKAIENCLPVCVSTVLVTMLQVWQFRKNARSNPRFGYGY